ncbi:MAG: LysE family transporter [Pseudomonadota bacterium]
MSLDGWLVFSAFWVLFVTTPGPNAVNCIGNGMTYGFRASLWGVLAILTQASLFLFLSAAGITALIAASEALFSWLKLIGAAFLIWLGIRGWMTAGRPVAARPTSARSIYGRAFLIATINAKSIAGYLAAFSQFVQPEVPIWDQMWAIVPTALTITAASYIGYTALGAWLGRRALGAVLNIWFRRAMGACFVIYGVLLGGSGLQGRGT